MQKLIVTALLALVFWACEANAAESAPGDVATDRKIAAQDVLTVIVVGEKDLPVEFPVSSTGTIQFPWLDELDVKDKTCSEVSLLIKALLTKDYIVDPQVFVAIKIPRKQYIRVMGQVVHPGLIDLPSEQKFDVIDALASAGGLAVAASENKITLTRKGKSTTYKLKQLKEITDPAQRVLVEADDLIQVGESIL